MGSSSPFYQIQGRPHCLRGDGSNATGCMDETFGVIAIIQGTL